MGKHMERNRAEREDEAYYAGQQSAAPAAPAAPAASRSGITAEDTNRLAELGKLHEQGVLTDEEFAQQKARILGMG
jgi:Short C-terminal domain